MLTIQADWQGLICKTSNQRQVASCMTRRQRISKYLKVVVELVGNDT